MYRKENQVDTRPLKEVETVSKRSELLIYQRK